MPSRVDPHEAECGSIGAIAIVARMGDNARGASPIGFACIIIVSSMTLAFGRTALAIVALRSVAFAGASTRLATVGGSIGAVGGAGGTAVARVRRGRRENTIVRTSFASSTSNGEAQTMVGSES